MTQEIKTTRLTGVNCYLVKSGDSGYVLIDTGFPMRRSRLEKELESWGCKPGNLMLIVITHADFDHAGNAAYLRKKFSAKIAMHPGETEVVESGDMSLSRKNTPFLSRIIFSFLKLGKSDRFKPDLYLDDGYDLTEYGFNAKVLHTPGHSKGSIVILTTEGDLFCGDLLINTDKPALNTLVDDSSEINASFEKLKGLGINTVYPGHGKPFPMELLLKNLR